MPAPIDRGLSGLRVEQADGDGTSNLNRSRIVKLRRQSMPTERRHGTARHVTSRHAHMHDADTASTVHRACNVGRSFNTRAGTMPAAACRFPDASACRQFTLFRYNATYPASISSSDPLTRFSHFSPAAFQTRTECTPSSA